MNNDTRDLDRNSTTDQSALERRLEDLVNQKLESIVAERITEEESKRFRQLKWVAVAIGLVGLGTFGTLANYLIQAAVDTRAGHVMQTMDMMRVNMLALKLDVSNSFTTAESHTVMLLLDKISSNNEAKALPDFPATLLKVLHAFSAASKDANLDRLMDLYRPEILASNEMVEAMIQHYGNQLAARAEVGQDKTADTALRNFQAVESVAESAHVPEEALLFRTLYESKIASTASAKDNVRDLIGRVQYLGQDDLANYVYILLRKSRASNWDKANPPSMLSQEIAATIQKFFAEYANELGEAFGADASEIKHWASHGVSEEDAHELGNRIGHHREI